MSGTEQHEHSDPGQAWFSTPEWRLGEQEASADIAAGRGTTFDNAEEFLASLTEQPETDQRWKGGAS